MPPVGFELTVSAGERPQTYLVDRAATGTGVVQMLITQNLTRTLGYLCFRGENPDINTSSSRACQTIEVQGVHTLFFILSLKKERSVLNCAAVPLLFFYIFPSKTRHISYRGKNFYISCWYQRMSSVTSAIVSQLFISLWFLNKLTFPPRFCFIAVYRW
jgi:hypothetical protein